MQLKQHLKAMVEWIMDKAEPIARWLVELLLVALIEAIKASVRKIVERIVEVVLQDWFG